MSKCRLVTVVWKGMLTNDTNHRVGGKRDSRVHEGTSGPLHRSRGDPEPDPRWHVQRDCTRAIAAPWKEKKIIKHGTPFTI